MDFMSALQKSKEKSGKSAREIAEACGLSDSTVARYLSGKSTPPIDIAQKILQYLDDAAPEGGLADGENITIPAWVYRKQINDMREDHQNTLKHMTRQHTLLFLHCAGAGCSDCISGAGCLAWRLGHLPVFQLLHFRRGAVMQAVIYARYSSHGQTEQSIEGQLRDCYAYAQREGLTVIGEYIDRAITGRTDDRPDFQRMISDAAKKQFQRIIVWKLDRFARNRYDSAFYKAKLKKFGVKVCQPRNQSATNQRA